MSSHSDVREKVVVLKRYIAKKISRRQAATRLGVSEKTVSVLKKQYLTGGIAALQHGSLGRSAVNRTSEIVEQQIVAYYKERYAGFNFTHFYEQLLDTGVLLAITKDIPPPSARTVERILTRNGVASPQAKRVPRKRAHPRRQRRAHFGELVQIDASYHDWLSLGSGHKITLHLYIDDATSMLLAGVFTPTESLAGYLRALQGVIVHYGVPEMLYSDRRSIIEYRKNKDTTLDRAQFNRICASLGISILTTSSPQAKGRIERSFRTHQDRLVNELRANKITTIEGANVYLQDYIARHNRRYAVPASSSKSHFSNLDERADIPFLLATTTPRTVLSGNIVSFKGSQYYPADQATGKRIVLSEGTVIEVKETLDERLFIYHNTTYYHATFFATGRSTAHTPADNHPWRNVTF